MEVSDRIRRAIERHPAKNDADISDMVRVGGKVVGAAAVSAIRGGGVASVKLSKTSAVQAAGMTRDRARLRHDVPARLCSELDSYIEAMDNELLYEEAEVKRACRVSTAELEYWESITGEPGYAQHCGYTEAGVRLWGTLDSIQWASDNITGFRKAV